MNARERTGTIPFRLRMSRSWCRLGWVIHVAVGGAMIVAGIVQRDLPPAALGLLLFGFAYASYRRGCAITLPTEEAPAGSHEPRAPDRLPR